jgi:hypothetical protein
MKPVCLCALVWLTAVSLPVAAADAGAGVYTIVEGDARVLRGAAWSKLAAGARAHEGDLLDLGERAQVQVEMPRAGVINIVGPASVYAAALPAADGKASGAAEWALARGWSKSVASAPGVRIRTALATVDVADGIVVLQGDAANVRLFVESGTARVGVPVARGKEAPPRDAHAGEFWARSGDKPFVVDARVPQAFVTSMPRHYQDALPRFAARFAGPAPALTAGPAIAYADAEPWLAGPYRRAFVKRLTPRLSDPAFRGDVEARIGSYPEWDRMLHPEKYAVEKSAGPK